MLSIYDLQVTYPGRLTALNPTSLTFDQGEFSVLLGPSGAGKVHAVAVPERSGPANERAGRVDGSWRHPLRKRNFAPASGCNRHGVPSITILLAA